jgi:pyruvate/2-oxoacid:ferredoxin oxidoreductase alpha subunit
MPPLIGYIAGLGGRDITTDAFKEIAADAMARTKAEEEIVWIGVKK